MNITIPYNPRKQMQEFHNSDARWKVLVIHRRFGKTTASLNHLQRDALRTPNARFAYIAPTYKAAKNIAWDMIREYSHMIPGIQYNIAELTVIYPNGSKLTLYGADNPDSLRGIALWGVVFDEYSQQPSNIFTEVIAPALADHKGYAIWIGTPKGKNEFYKLSQKAKIEEGWRCWILKASETGVLSDDEIRVQRSLLSPDEYDQEFECSFEASTKGAYYKDQVTKMRNEDRIGNVPYEVMLPVYTWWDLGMSDSTTIGFFQFVGREVRMIDYYEASGEGLNHYAGILQQKGYTYAEHYAPHDIQVRELGTGKSRKEIAANFGINFLIAPNLPISDGINAARLRMNRLWVDENKCERFIDAISQYRKEWNDKMGDYKPTPLHDWTSHAADMFRYFAVTEVHAPDIEMQHRVQNNRSNPRTFK